MVTRNFTTTVEPAATDVMAGAPTVSVVPVSTQPSASASDVQYATGFASTWMLTSVAPG